MVKEFPRFVRRGRLMTGRRHSRMSAHEALYKRIPRLRIFHPVMVQLSSSNKILLPFF